jgi:chitosanase
MFSEKIPTNGGDEKQWITAYCKARKQWLANHSRTILHSTVYRMNMMLSLIEKDDWAFSQPYYIANDVRIIVN